MEKQVIQSTGFRNIVENGEVTGFQVKIRLPYYRGVYLSQIKPGHLIVDGETFGEDEIMWRVNVKKPGGLAQGYHDITYGFYCTHSYMPPAMEALEDPDKPSVVYFVEFGQNVNSRRLLIV